jgi:hypothetical protein
MDDETPRVDLRLISPETRAMVERSQRAISESAVLCRQTEEALQVLHRILAWNKHQRGIR